MPIKSVEKRTDVSLIAELKRRNVIHTAARHPLTEGCA
jgi:hypothetical protein